MSREALKSSLDERREFTGTFEREGTKRGWRGRKEHTILMKDIVDVARGEMVADHLWFSLTNEFKNARLKSGDRVKFRARVKTYEKGYFGSRKWGYEPSRIDYKLFYPTKVCEVDPEPDLDHLRAEHEQKARQHRQEEFERKNRELLDYKEEMKRQRQLEAAERQRRFRAVRKPLHKFILENLEVDRSSKSTDLTDLSHRKQPKDKARLLNYLASRLTNRSEVNSKMSKRGWGEYVGYLNEIARGMVNEIYEEEIGQVVRKLRLE